LIYENVVASCKKRGISIAALEKRAGLGNATIRGWKTSSPNVSSVKRVADYLHCTVDDLLKEDE